MSDLKFRISRPSYSDGREKVDLTLTCNKSGVRIIQAEINLDDFTKALMGQESGADLSFLIGQKGFDLIGKTREVYKYSIAKPDDWGYCKPTRDQIESELTLLGLLPDWELWQDGLSTQQNKRGYHNVVLCKYV